jgi:hypothetical protein
VTLTLGACVATLGQAHPAKTPGEAHPAKAPSASASMDSLWVEPSDLESRDLYWGPGGESLAPHAGGDFKFVEADTAGHSKGYRVEDAQGHRWKVKLGEEAQSEVVVSRILWAIGYHQPANYYVVDWRLTGGPATSSTPGPGCFRYESDHEKLGEWDWWRNPFTGTREMDGLMVANLVLNNWDMGPSQNRIYEVKHAHDGAKVWYVVQDVGAALGKSTFPLGSRNKVADFESQDLLRKLPNGHLEFDYHSVHRLSLSKLGPDDVVWACRLLSRLSDHQLGEAFRAAGYTPDVSGRYVRKIREKIAQGLALEAPTGKATTGDTTTGHTS